jgi:acyl-CoA synthetase (AMP-forming)/AMP-acid ligase II
MSELFLDALERTAVADAVAVSDATESLTYGQLRDEAQRVAARLADTYPEAGFIVIRAASTVRFVVTMLGVMYRGATPVPIDRDLPAAGVEFIRCKSGAAGVIDPFELRDLENVCGLERRRADVPALVMFTSGTSGFPKGVVVSNANLLASCRAISEYLGYDAFPSAAVALPLHYSYALISQVLCQLLVGGRVHLFHDLRNPLKFAKTVNELGLETFCGVPSTFHALTMFHELSPISMPGVRVLCSAGAAMDFTRFAAVKRIFPNSVFYNNYGMTEAAPRIAFCREGDPRFHEPTCGRPMAGVDVKIVDPVTHEEVADGTRGVLVVRGPNITSGYLNDPEQTARAFTRDGFLISGDVAYRDRGYLFVCGRLDDVFNCGGEKVVPLEIERVLNGVAGVEMSALAGIADEQRGMVPVAFLKLADPTLTRASLVQQLARELPKSKIPQLFVEVRAFPMTSNGKVQRRRLSPTDRDLVIREIR